MRSYRQLIKIIILLIILGGLFFLIDSYWRWSKHYRNEIYPRTKIGNLNLGGKTPQEAQAFLAEKTREIENSDLKFVYNNKEIIINTAVSSFDADLSYPALTYQLDQTIQTAFGKFPQHSFGNYLLYRLTAKQGRSLTAGYYLNQAQIKNLLLEHLPDLEIPAENAYFSLNAQNQLVINPEKMGKEINYDHLFSTLHTNLGNLKNETIPIKTRTKYPAVKEVDLSSLDTEIKTIINQGSLFLNIASTSLNLPTDLQKKTWEIKPTIFITWIGARLQDNNLTLFLDTDKIKQYLQKEVAPDIDQEAIRPRFEMKNNKVSNWQVGKNGRQLNLDNNAKKIAEEFFNSNNQIFLIIEEVMSEDVTEENSFNIQEIIGVGHSNFSGSPANRIHNIKTGAAAVHGLLIKPNEEFSLVKNLGEIDESSGYLPELVIKGNKTIPEYGGGLCQIGTTIFRSALSSGLPITARQNHSYRVSYYEPAGTDAAVYDPWPDVRFINDTKNYILIQSRLEGNDIYFDFWGVKDGRQATTTYPTIYNIVKPAPTKIVETSDLLPGQKKCTERAHNGADAFFDYIVTYPEGSTTTPQQERRFNSHYVPWQEVCLVGASQASTTPPVNPATTTPTVAATSTNN